MLRQRDLLTPYVNVLWRWMAVWVELVVGWCAELFWLEFTPFT